MLNLLLEFFRKGEEAILSLLLIRNVIIHSDHPFRKAALIRQDCAVADEPAPEGFEQRPTL